MTALPELLTVTVALEVGVVIDGARHFEVEVRPLTFNEVMSSMVDAAANPRPAGFTEKAWEKLAELARQVWVPTLDRCLTVTEVADVYQADAGHLFDASKEVASRAESFRAQAVGAGASDDCGDDGEGAELVA